MVRYAASVLGFSLASALFLYFLQRIQGVLPLSDGLSGVSPAVAFNTAISFVANTNWQSYTPETTMSNFVQPVGLAVQNFVSAAVGMAVAIALVRGFIRVARGRRDRQLLGRSDAWFSAHPPPVLIRDRPDPVEPGSDPVVPQRFRLHRPRRQCGHQCTGPRRVPGSDQGTRHQRWRDLGCQLGAPVREPPPPLSNVVEILAILLIPVCLTRTFGTLVGGDRRQGLTLLAVMGILWSGLLAVTLAAESGARGVAATAAGSMMEGKEVRFGIPRIGVVRGGDHGNVDGRGELGPRQHVPPLGGGAVLLNMLLGEIAPGGVGTGLYGILVLALIAVFVGGLLVGRTPEYLGKKLGRREITLAALSILVMPALVLIGTAITVILGSTTGYQGNGGRSGYAGIDPRVQ